MMDTLAGWDDLDQGLFSISVAAQLAGLHPQTLRIYDGLNLAGIRRVLALQAETSRLQAEIDRLQDGCARPLGGGWAARPALLGADDPESGGGVEVAQFLGGAAVVRAVPAGD
ncbi:MAG TPA: hypothetical protein VG268_17320, partial [Streptosporangiaceae bacterium]|nr:hypothetical protein [Streptosporangiaceae bacterium]